MNPNKRYFKFSWIKQEIANNPEMLKALGLEIAPDQSEEGIKTTQPPKHARS